MVSGICETIRVGSDLLTSGLDVKVVSNGQSIKATCAAMVATYYWVLWRKAANANGMDLTGKISADNSVVEVWHV
jgi:hypothetical protein